MDNEEKSSLEVEETPKFDDFEAGDMLPEAPEVEESLENLNTEEINIPENIIDKKGNKFDPEIFRTNENGVPLFNKDGSFKKQYRKKGQIEKPAVNIKEQAKASSVVFTGLFIQTGEVVLGDFQPESKEERQNLESAFYAYFLENGIVDVPPSIALVMALTGYTIPRLQKTEPKNRIKGYAKKVYSWFKKRTTKQEN
jgi:hypothetical protein